MSPLVLCSSGDTRIPFKAVYQTLGFKESEAKVFLVSMPITARILEVERFTAAHDRFTQRSASKVRENKLSLSLSLSHLLCLLLCLTFGMHLYIYKHYDMDEKDAYPLSII